MSGTHKVSAFSAWFSHPEALENIAARGTRAIPLVQKGVKKSDSPRMPMVKRSEFNRPYFHNQNNVWLPNTSGGNPLEGMIPDSQKVMDPKEKSRLLSQKQEKSSAAGSAGPAEWTPDPNWKPSWDQSPWTDPGPNPNRRMQGFLDQTGMYPNEYRYEQAEAQAAGYNTNRPVPTAASNQSTSSGSGGSTWAERFYAEHGYWPDEQDDQDRQWSEWFAQTYGRPPSQADWEAHYYESQGGGGGGSSAPAFEGTVAELLTKLKFPKQTGQVESPYLRDWVSYLQETMQKNPTLGNIPLPETVNGEVARFWTNEQERTKFRQNVQSPYDTLQGMMGFPQHQFNRPGSVANYGANTNPPPKELGEYSPADQWQIFMNRLKRGGLPQEAEQQLASLRYDPNLANWDQRVSGWYRDMIDLLPNRREL